MVLSTPWASKTTGLFKKYTVYIPACVTTACHSQLPWNRDKKGVFKTALFRELAI